MKLRCSLLLVVLSFAALSFALGARCGAAQEDQDNYFTGTLVESTPDHLKVTRESGSKEQRVFKLNAQTKIEGGRLRLRERVTVRYVSGDDGYTAIIVSVRPATTQPKKQK